MKVAILVGKTPPRPEHGINKKETHPTCEMTHLKSSGLWLAQAHTNSPPLDAPCIASLYEGRRE